MRIRIKKLSDTAIIPTAGSCYAAGYDLYANIETTIQPRQTVKIPTGLAMEIPQGYFGGIFARSGLATKVGLRPANCVGVVDSDYRGEIIVALHNDSDLEATITFHQRIAQLVVLPYLPIEFEQVEQLEDSSRGENGFGSTGK